MKMSMGRGGGVEVVILSEVVEGRACWGGSIWGILRWIKSVLG